MKKQTLCTAAYYLSYLVAITLAFAWAVEYPTEPTKYDCQPVPPLKVDNSGPKPTLAPPRPPKATLKIGEFETTVTVEVAP
jgi:hypothetical protein